MYIYLQEMIFNSNIISRCVVIEDSLVGLKAAKAAGMR